MEVKVDLDHLGHQDHPRSQWLVVAVVLPVDLDIEDHQDHTTVRAIVEMEMVVLGYNSHNLLEHLLVFLHLIHIMDIMVAEAEEELEITIQQTDLVVMVVLVAVVLVLKRVVKAQMEAQILVVEQEDHLVVLVVVAVMVDLVLSLSDIKSSRHSINRLYALQETPGGYYSIWTAEGG